MGTIVDFSETQFELAEEHARKRRRRILQELEQMSLMDFTVDDLRAILISQGFSIYPSSRNQQDNAIDELEKRMKAIKKARRRK